MSQFRKYIFRHSTKENESFSRTEYLVRQSSTKHVDMLKFALQNFYNYLFMKKHVIILKCIFFLTKGFIKKNGSHA